MNILKWLVPCSFLLFVFTSCNKDELLTDPSVMLEFSADTIVFDTVFTTVGSTTEILKFYNREDQDIEVSSIKLEGGSSSPFRINVDGIAGTHFENVLVPAEDSLFIFVEVTIDPTNSNNPLIFTDNIVFITNGNTQDIDLVAWGQDAHFFYGQQFAEGFPDLICLDGLCDNGNAPVNVTWPNDKPYVIYGYLRIDEGDRLKIDSGCQIHFHEGSGLWVFEGGIIEACGTLEDPIVFQGDRLEPEFDEIPGQWDRIWINENDAGNPNIFNHCIIKNNFLGIQAEPLVLNEDDALGPGAVNSLELNNTIIKNNSGASLLIRNYNIDAVNCLFANAGQFNCAITGEGEYRFNFCTFGNYWNFGTRSDPAFFISNRFQDVFGNVQVRELGPAYITNSVIYGNSFNELGYDLDDGGVSNELVFDRVLVKIDDLDVSDDSIFPNLIVNQNPRFVNPSDGDFHLESNSPLINRPLSFLNPVVPNDDLEGNFAVGNRDWGAYEFVD